MHTNVEFKNIYCCLIKLKKGTNGGVMISELAAAAAGRFTMDELVLVPGSGISGLV